MFFRRWWPLPALGILGALTKPKQSVVPFSICMAGTWWLFSARRAAESARHGVLGRLPHSSAQWRRLRFFNRLSDLAMELRSQSGCALELCVELCGLVRRQGFLSTSPGRYWILSAATLLCQVGRGKTRAVSSERAQPSGATPRFGTET